MPREMASERNTQPAPESGILAALPRTRPQRPSARREAARAAGGADVKSETAGERGAPARASSRTQRTKTSGRAKPSTSKTSSRAKTSAFTSEPAPAEAGATKRPAAAPKRVAIQPKRTAADPKRTATQPKRTAADPKRTATQPKRIAADAKRTATPPKRTAADAKRTAGSAAATSARRKAGSTPAARVEPAGRGRPKPADRVKAKPEPPVPKQGYEPEEEVELGTTVDPPSGVELIESLADIFGELASASAGGGARLFKEALSIFRRP